LNAVSRSRVANVRIGSEGAETIESVRELPSSSVSGGSNSDTSAAWPALKTKPAGFSTLNASVASATSVLPTSATLAMVSVLSISPSFKTESCQRQM
jgi:hypothetical protein